MAVPLAVGCRARGHGRADVPDVRRRWHEDHRHQRWFRADQSGQGHLRRDHGQQAEDRLHQEKRRHRQGDQLRQERAVLLHLRAGRTGGQGRGER